MNHHQLREIAKFLSGAVAAKILITLWFSTAGLMPVILAGTPFTVDSVFPAMIFNVGVLAILVYYGWHVKSPVHAPSERKLLLAAGVVFLIVALIHFMRVLFGWDVIVGDTLVPEWFSWFGVLLALYLAYASFHFAMRMKGKNGK